MFARKRSVAVFAGLLMMTSACAAMLAATAGASGASVQSDAKQNMVLVGGEIKRDNPQLHIRNAQQLYEDVAVVDAPGLKDRKAIRVYGDQEMAAEFHPVEVTPGHVYALSLQSRWEHDVTLREMPPLHVLLGRTSPSAAPTVPGMKLAFLDAQGKAIGHPLYAALPFGHWHATRFIFSAPANAAKLLVSVHLGQNDGALYVLSPELRHQGDARSGLVISFAQNQGDATGFIHGWAIAGNLRRTETGKLLVDSGYGSRSDLIPLSTPGRYRLSIQGQHTGGFRKVTLDMLDEKGKSVGQVTSDHLLEQPAIFTLPKGATHVRLLVYSHLMEAIRIEPVK